MVARGNIIVATVSTVANMRNILGGPMMSQSFEPNILATRVVSPMVE